MHTKIIVFCKRLRAIYESEAENINLPNFTHFPNNCCQQASLYLAVLLSSRFPAAHIQLIYGTHKFNRECHYWLEVNGFCYDITADQFDDVASPIYGGLSSPLAPYFSMQQVRDPIQDFSQYDKLDKQNRAGVLQVLEKLLAQPRTP